MRRLFGILTAIFAFALIGAPARADAPSYPLDCVFDGSQRVGTYLELAPPTAIADPHFTPALVSQMVFRPATRPASMGVDPGTCAWRDRAFRSGEPVMMEEVFDPAWVTERRDGQTITYPGQPNPVDPLVGYWVTKVGDAGFRLTCMARTQVSYGFNPAAIASAPRVIRVSQCH